MKVDPAFQRFIDNLNDCDPCVHPDEALLDLCDQFCDQWEALTDGSLKAAIGGGRDGSLTTFHPGAGEIMALLEVIIKTPALYGMARDAKLRVLQLITPDGSLISRLIGSLACDYFCSGLKEIKLISKSSY